MCKVVYFHFKKKNFTTALEASVFLPMMPSKTNVRVDKVSFSQRKIYTLVKDYFSGTSTTNSGKGRARLHFFHVLASIKDIIHFQYTNNIHVRKYCAFHVIYRPARIQTKTILLPSVKYY